MRNKNTEKHDYIMLVGIYPDRDTAMIDQRELNGAFDHEALRELSSAVISRNEKGKLEVHQATSDGKDGAAAGLAVGALPGIALAAVFPPAGAALLGFSVVTGASFSAIMGAVGHYTGGFSRETINEAADMLHGSEAAILAVIRETDKDVLDDHLKNATSKMVEPLSSEDADEAMAHLVHVEEEKAGAEAAFSEVPEEALAEAK